MQNLFTNRTFFVINTHHFRFLGWWRYGSEGSELNQVMDVTNRIIRVFTWPRGHKCSIFAIAFLISSIGQGESNICINGPWRMQSKKHQGFFSLFSSGVRPPVLRWSGEQQSTRESENCRLSCPGQLRLRQNVRWGNGWPDKEILRQDTAQGKNYFDFSE